MRYWHREVLGRRAFVAPKSSPGPVVDQRLARTGTCFNDDTGAVMGEVVAIGFLVVGGIVIGPWVAIALHGSRLRSIEDEVACLGRLLRDNRTPPPRPHAANALGEITEQIRHQRESSAPPPGDSLDLVLPVGPLDLGDGRDEGDSDDGDSDDGEQAATPAQVPADKTGHGDSTTTPDLAPADDPSEQSPWSELAVPPSRKSARDQSDDQTELMIVRVMTWVGVITLVLGVGFLYRYALAQGWISDTSRVIGGLVTGIAGFFAAIQCRRRDYVFFGDCVAAASSGVIKLSIYAAAVWYQMISAGTGFRGFLMGGAALWAYAVFFESRLAASLATFAALLTPALLPDYVGPTAAASVNVFAGYLLVINLTVAAVTWIRAWRLPAGIAAVGTGIHLAVWYANAFSPSQMSTALAWLAGFTVLFIAHGILACIKTKAEHPLDSPILVAGASFLAVAAMGVNAEADYLTKAITPTALAAGYLATWLAFRSKLAGQLANVLQATVAFLLAVSVPFWLSPAWTLVSWAALAWIWGRLAIRDDRPIAGIVALVIFAFVQLLAAAVAISTTLRGDVVPLPIWSWTVTGSLTGQLKALFDTVPVASAGLLGTLFHARSLSLLACGAAAFAMRREAARRESFARIDMSPKALATTLGAIGVINWTAISLSELTHAAVRNDWTASTSIAIWTFHFCVLAVLAVFWFHRGTSADDRQTTATSLLKISIASAIVGLLAVIVEALAIRHGAEILAPLFSLRSAFMLGSAAVLSVPTRLLSDHVENTRWLDLKRLTSTATTAILTIWGISETVQLGKWAGLSTEEVSALLTAILGLAGVATLAYGFIKRDVGRRRTGLLLLGLATTKIYLLDIWTASSEVRTIAFIVLGATLLGAAFLYRAYRDQFQEWLGDGKDVLR